MSTMSKLKLKLTGGLVFSGFYFVTGVVMFLLLVWSGGSIVASYGLNRMKRWVLYILTMLLFMGVTFGVVMVYTFIRWFGQDLTVVSIQAVIVVYMIMLIVSFLDALKNRKRFV
jgi:hypothetical protein